MRGRVIFVIVVAVLVYGISRQRSPSQAPAAPPGFADPQNLAVERDAPVTAFKCDGRTRCPEMRSCEEATFFLRNCPGVKMDGDNDGVPCEDQYCGRR